MIRKNEKRNRMKRQKMPTEKPEIPGFTLLSCCGTGKVSKVWLGMDRRRNMHAIRLVSKTLDPALLTAERRGLRLYRLQGGEHANLMKILDFGETTDHLYSIMDPADNISLEHGCYEPDTLAGRMKYQMPFHVVLQYLDAVLAGMMHLHERDLAHCDLKPENILFVDRVLKISDPGLVLPSGMRSSGGTAGFRPPWPASGKECDIYAFGKMIYMLCTREDPQSFPEIPERFDLAAFMPLNEIALGCCESDPNRRFRDAEEIRRELNQVRCSPSIRYFRICASGRNKRAGSARTGSRWESPAGAG